ncbi:hypothetical protein Tco_1527887, partial [Tanacetum coccineum]
MASLRAPELGPPAILAMIDKTPYTITEEIIVTTGRGKVPTGRVKVPTSRVKVPAGRYVVPTGKDYVIVSTGRSKVIPAGRRILVL